MEFIETPNKRYIVDNLWHRYGTHTFFLQEEFLSFEEVKEFIRKLKLKNIREWYEYSKSGKRPNNIPSTPDRTYKDEWLSWGDFLGNGNKKKENYINNLLPLDEVKKCVRSMGITTCSQWEELCSNDKKPDRIPSNISRVYKDHGWISWADLFGTNRLRRQYNISFEEAKQIVRNLGIKSSKEWFNLCRSGKQPYNVPISLHTYYRHKGWRGWKDFLGKNHLQYFLSFEEAKSFVKKLNLTSVEWMKYRVSDKKPDNIPTNPNQTYKNTGWISWPDFLGTGNVFKKDFISYEEAKKLMKKLGIKTHYEWRIYCQSGQRPNNVPSNPHVVYKNEWIDWYDFLGKTKKSA